MKLFEIGNKSNIQWNVNFERNILPVSFYGFLLDRVFTSEISYIPDMFVYER